MKGQGTERVRGRREKPLVKTDPSIPLLGLFLAILITLPLWAGSAGMVAKCATYYFKDGSIVLMPLLLFICFAFLTAPLITTIISFAVILWYFLYFLTEEIFYVPKDVRTPRIVGFILGFVLALLLGILLLFWWR